jgi:hypothetical protein
MSLLDTFDSVFAITFTCFLPPPYDTAYEVEEVIDAQIERAGQLKSIIRHNRKKR